MTSASQIPPPARRIVELPQPELRRLEFILACAVVFFAPMNILRAPGFYFTASDMFACLCLGVMFLNRRVSLNPFGPATGFWVFGLILMVGALLVSSLLVGAVIRGLILTGQYLFAYLMLPIVLLNRNAKHTRILMLVFMASIAVVVLHGIYVVDVLHERNTHFVSGNGRLRGLVERENECGALIALTVPMLLSMTLTGALSPYLAVVLLPLFAYGIMLTGSNTALYSLLFGMGFVFVASITPKRALTAAIGVSLVLVMVQMPAVTDNLPAVFQKRVLVGLKSGDLEDAGTFADRMELNSEAFRLGGNSMFVGYGADQYRVLSKWKAPVHNFYLLIWNEGGLFSLAGFLILLFGGAMLVAMAWGYRQGRIHAVCGVATLILFALLVSAVPHVYARFWLAPLLLSLAPALDFLNSRPVRGIAHRSQHFAPYTALAPHSRET